MFLVFNDPQAIAQYVSERLVKLVKSNPQAVLGLATGSTMEPVYQQFCADAKEQALDVSQLISFNLDEYIGLAPEHPQSYHHFMNKHLFNHLNFAKQKTFLPDGMPEDIEAHCQQYSQKIAEYGGIDLQLLGVGSNGHIGFNEPGTSFDSRTHVVQLYENTRLDNGRFFDSIDEVPTQAITIGLRDIMDAREIVFVATGDKKAQVMLDLYESQVDEKMPASILKNHPNALFIVDKKAAGLLPIAACEFVD